MVSLAHCIFVLYSISFYSTSVIRTMKYMQHVQSYISNKWFAEDVTVVRWCCEQLKRPRAQPRQSPRAQLSQNPRVQPRHYPEIIFKHALEKGYVGSQEGTSHWKKTRTSCSKHQPMSDGGTLPETNSSQIHPWIYDRPNPKKERKWTIREPSTRCFFSVSGRM